MKAKFIVLLLIMSGALYLASLYQPALLFADRAPLLGWDVLCWGWWGLLTFDPAWLANPAYVATVILIGMRHYSAALIASSMAVLLAVTSFFAKQWWFHEGYGTPITALGSGFYIWLAGLVGAWLSAFVAWRTGNGKKLL